MNNEPVAWMEIYCGKPNNLFWSVKEAETIHPYGVIPLYTHPVKELTDEEIYAEMVKCIDSPNDGHEFRYKDFARAILRKAQEK